MTTPLGLVVVTYQSSDVLEGFVESLTHSTLRPHHIVVVDNSPTVLTAPRMNDLPPIEVIHRPDNPGYGGAANLGVSALPAECEWVVVCNPDIVVEPSTLETLLEVARTRPDAGALGPGIVNEDGSLYPSARAIPTLGIGIGHALLGIVWPANPWTRAYRGDYRSEQTRETGWLSGAFLLIRRNAFETIGGFDTGYFMFFEDVDLGWRLDTAGFTNLYVPSARALHIGGTSTSRNYEAMLAAHHSSAMRFIRARYPGIFWAPLRGLISLGLTVRERILRSRALQLD